MKRNLSIISLLTLAVLIFSPLNVVYAASASLSPTSGSYEVNSAFMVSIYENSDATAVDTVQATLTYDSAVLQFVSLSVAGSPFTTCLQTTGGSGSVNITCASLEVTKPVGSQFVGNVTFKALAGSGTTIVPASVLLLSAGTAVANVAAQGTYTLTTPVVAATAANNAPATTQHRTTAAVSANNSTAESTVTAETSTEQTLAAVIDTTAVSAETTADASDTNWGIIWLVSLLGVAIVAASIIWRKTVISKATPVIKKLRALVGTTK